MLAPNRPKCNLGTHLRQIGLNVTYCILAPNRLNIIQFFFKHSFEKKIEKKMFEKKF